MSDAYPPQVALYGSLRLFLLMNPRTIVALVAVTAPMILAAEMVTNCWWHGRTRKICDPEGQVPLMVQATLGSAFAFLATPPQ